MGFATDAIHVGQEPDPATGAIVAPIYQTSTYVQEELGKNKGYDYARTNHPNRKALERTMAKLEGGSAAYVFTSGMAAIDSLFRLLRPGDHAIISEAVYGGVIRLTTQFLVQWGLEFSFVDTSSPELVERSIRKNTRMIYVETPTNPTMRVTNIAAIARISSAHNATLSVDNTFLSPYLQSPIALGRANRRSFDDEIPERPQRFSGRGIDSDSRGRRGENLFPATLDGRGACADGLLPDIAGIKTLAVRMAQHDANGRVVARYLEEHPRVKTVALSRFARSPSARDRAPATARIWSNDFFRRGHPGKTLEQCSIT